MSVTKNTYLTALNLPHLPFFLDFVFFTQYLQQLL